MSKRKHFEDLPRAVQDEILEACQKRGRAAPRECIEINIPDELERTKRTLVFATPIYLEALKELPKAEDITEEQAILLMISTKQLIEVLQKLLNLIDMIGKSHE